MTTNQPNHPESEKTATDFLNEKLAELSKTIADFNESLAVGKKELLRGAFTQASIEVLEEKIAAFESEKSALLKAIDHIPQPEKKVTDDKSAGVEEAKWNTPDENGMVDVPDHLMPLLNKVGTQFRFHTISGKSEAQAVIDIVYLAEKFFTQQSQLATGAMVEENERLREALQKIVNGRTTKNMSKILSDTQMARIAKQALTPKP